jgi:hypothetical protein
MEIGRRRYTLVGGQTPRATTRPRKKTSPWGRRPHHSHRCQALSGSAWKRSSENRSSGSSKYCWRRSPNNWVSPNQPVRGCRRSTRGTKYPAFLAGRHFRATCWQPELSSLLELVLRFRRVFNALYGPTMTPLVAA